MTFGVGCILEDCDREHHARGFCGTHYRRLRLYGDPLGRPVKQLARPARCVIDECDGANKSMGYCAKHYYRLRKYGGAELTRIARAESITELAWCGYSLGRIADRLGIQPESVERALWRAGRHDLRDRLVAS